MKPVPFTLGDIHGTNELDGLPMRTSNVVTKAVEDLENGNIEHGASGSGRNSMKATAQPRLEELGRSEESELEDGDLHPRGFVLAILTVGLMAAVFMVALDNYILATAIPTIATEFNSLNEVGWYGSSYFLTQMAFQPAFGQMFTYSSVKVVYMAAVVIFEIGSIICASAKTSANLIIGRLIAGAGGAGLYVGTLTIVGRAIPMRKRPIYLALITSVFGVASVAGPLLGGVFTDSSTLTWRFCFWVNLPIGLMAFLLITFSFQMPSQSQKQSLPLKDRIIRADPVGVILLISGFVCLLLALQWAGITYAWSNSRVWGCLLGFGLILGSFILLQIWRRNEANIPLHLVSQRTVAASCGFILFVSMDVGLLIYYLPFYFQAVLGTSAQKSGIENLPYLVSSLFSPLISGGLITALGYYVPFMWLGAILLTIGSSLLFTLKIDSSSAAVVGYQLLAGFGAGIANQIPFTAVQYVLPKDQMVLGSALVSFCNSLGPIFGVSIAQAIFTGSFVQRLERVPDIDAAAVIKAGPTSAATVVPLRVLPVVREAFDHALTRTFILAIVGGGAAFCCSLAMEWGNIKKESLVTTKPATQESRELSET